MQIILKAISLRDCQMNDYEFIHDLSKENMENFVEKFWGAWNKEKFISKIKKENIKIVEYNNESIGFIDYEIIDNEAYLHNLQIKKHFQRKKIGYNLMLIMEQNIKKNGIEKINLQVFSDSPAKNFYEKFGFSMVKDSENSVIMEKNIELTR